MAALLTALDNLQGPAIAFPHSQFFNSGDRYSMLLRVKHAGMSVGVGMFTHHLPRRNIYQTVYSKSGVAAHPNVPTDGKIATKRKVRRLGRVSPVL